jgi:hypothetical protein
MSVYTHAALGAAVGVAVGNPLVAFFLGAATHIVSDTVAHFDCDRVWLEVILAVAAGAFLWWLSGRQTTVLCGILGAVSPDLDNLLISIKAIPARFKVFPSHGGYLRHGAELGAVNSMVQVVVFGLFALWVYVAPELL